MADTDPPDEVDDGEAPADRDIDTPDADAFDEEPSGRAHQQLQDAESDQEPEDPSDGGLAFEDDAADFVRYGRKTVAFVDYRPDFNL
jgi:hypothetical protein